MEKKTWSELCLDPRWQKLRLEVFERDGWACTNCGAKDNTLHAHHTFYYKKYHDPWDYPPWSIVTLCGGCHSEEHDMDGAGEALIQSLRMHGLSSKQLNDVCGMLQFCIIQQDKRHGEVIFDVLWSLAADLMEGKWADMLRLPNILATHEMAQEAAVVAPSET